MPSYQATAVKTGADGKTELVASHEFEAADTPAAKAAAHAWSQSGIVTSTGSTSIKLFAGKVLLAERAQGGDWKDAPRS